VSLQLKFHVRKSCTSVDSCCYVSGSPETDKSWFGICHADILSRFALRMPSRIGQLQDPRPSTLFPCENGDDRHSMVPLPLCHGGTLGQICHVANVRTCRGTTVSSPVQWLTLMVSSSHKEATVCYWRRVWTGPEHVWWRS